MLSPLSLQRVISPENKSLFIIFPAYTDVCTLYYFNVLPTASQAAAQARGQSSQQSAAASSITGMSLQEAQQILNISTLSPEEIQKVQTSPEWLPPATLAFSSQWAVFFVLVVVGFFTFWFVIVKKKIAQWLQGLPMTLILEFYLHK